MKYNFISTKVEGHVFYLTLDREAKRNAFTPTMVNELAYALEEAKQNPTVNLLVLQAKGPVFCAGMDLKTYQDRSLDQLNPAIENKNISLGEVFDQFNKPSIAILDGDVIAGGFLYILGCTYVFAKKEVQFKLPELSFGIFPFQVMASLSRVMSEKKIMQLCLDPNAFGSEKAMEFGILDGIKSDEEIQEFIASFAQKSTFAMQAGADALKAIRDMESAKQYDYLLSCLEQLKDREEVKQQIQSGIKKP
ncbi:MULTISPECIES: enoyl-CoA hydratase/isomerase family protein [Sphingobacterium]|uniref:Enoyl-CoA hydratase/isomerase family protein n=1 Tax=Sphingobacterium tenebrionis TaxID=3111775 RepID=A0ABU8I0N6_9SPHI|nr:enoyl-CoA hydratase/isomerase family protein [Sphingobacterium sp. CZ-2]QBR10648.1 enoyl-CoA hydratase/isomerase family protein [Sphingobacterium sp. CZ-2]